MDLPAIHPRLLTQYPRNPNMSLESQVLKAFASPLDTQPPEVQEAFQFLLATAMHEAGKFELLNVAEVDGRWHYTFSGAGEVFSVVRPEISKEMECQVREKVRRMTADTALTRNRFVAALADTVLIAHAQPGSKTEQLAQEVVDWGKQVYTLDHPANEHLLVLGAKPLAPVYQKESC